MQKVSDVSANNFHRVRFSLRYLSAVNKTFKNYKNMAVKLHLYKNIVELLYDLYRTSDS